MLKHASTGDPRDQWRNLLPLHKAHTIFSCSAFQLTFPLPLTNLSAFLQRNHCFSSSSTTNFLTLQLNLHVIQPLPCWIYMPPICAVSNEKERKSLSKTGYQIPQKLACFLCRLPFCVNDEPFFTRCIELARFSMASKCYSLWSLYLQVLVEYH